MAKKKMYVQDSHGEIQWEYVYEDMTELTKDLMALMKPSLFGKSIFRIVVKDCEE